MARKENQKIKLSVLTQIMLEKTDEDHALTLPQIINELEKRDIPAERKSLYADFSDMSEKLGIDVVKEQRGRETFYYVASRDFELAEVKLLIDAIQASKFITEKKSNELISKIKGFVSEHQASTLSRQVYVQGRAKTMNESIYYNVDDIHKAIGANKKISFKYYKWDVSKKLVERHGGAIFTVSPWALTWDDENYYLVAFDELSSKMKHYRVDKMKHIEILDAERVGKETFKDYDMASYSAMNFGMYNGEKKKVRIEFENSMAGVFIDRFGTGISIMPTDSEHSSTVVDVAVSPQFFGWIFGLGNGVRVTAPDEVVDQLHQASAEFFQRYSGK